MFQRSPSSVKPVVPDRPPAPAPVQNAVKLIYVGAAVNTIYMIVALVTIRDIKGELRRLDHKLTASQINSEANFFIVTTVVFGIVITALWLWMAWANREGRHWARVTSTVFWFLWLFYVLNTVTRVPSIGIIFPALELAAGLGAVILLWRKESGAFFKPPGLL
jgi:hypothetical protein